MFDEKRSINEINRKLASDEAVVMTASQLLKSLSDQENLSWKDVDVVTSATCGLMSGTAAILSFPAAKRGSFKRASEVFLNGVPAYPGPAPNEGLGIIDCIVHGTMESRTIENYGGGNLFRDIAMKKEIQLELRTDKGDILKGETNIREMNFARLEATRNCFLNYSAFVNRSDEKMETIFHTYPFPGKMKEATVSGCGELNPLTRDPKLSTIGVGTRILMNGTTGYISGSGTRATSSGPNISGFAELGKMDPYYMGGFRTSQGMEVINSIAVPIPITEPKIFETVSRSDRDMELKISDVTNRIPFTHTNYSRVWKGTDLGLKFNRKKCLDKNNSCNTGSKNGCPVQQICPTSAFDTKGAALNMELCFHCGACVKACPHDAFEMNTGTLPIDEKDIPITLRQSSRFKGERLANLLKKKLEAGEFYIAEKLEDIRL